MTRPRGRAAWPPALSALAHALGGAGGVLFAMDKVTGRMPVSVVVGPAEQAAAAGRAYRRRHPGATVLYDDMYTSEAEMDRSPHYDQLRRAGLRYHLAAPLLDDARWTVALMVQRTSRAGHVQASEIATFARLVPHLEEAARMGVRAIEMDAAMSGGVIVADGAGRVREADPGAETILTRGDGLRVDRAGLRAARPAETASLQRLVAAAASNRRRSAPGGMVALSREAGSPYDALVMPLSARPRPDMVAGAGLAVILVREPVRASAATFGPRSRAEA